MMISASPDYAITKPPGMAHHLSRKRDKPLRTYGKRSTATPEPRGEPPTKRARTDGKEAETDAVSEPLPARADEESVASNDADVSHKEQPETDRRKPASILNYFKPVPRPKEAALPTAEPESTISEPSAAQSRPKRKTRLLRIRATSSPLSDAVDDNADARPQVKDSGGKGNSDKDANADEGGSRRGEPLHDGGENLLNQTRPEGDDVTAKGGGPAKAKTPTVQTTLNISAQAAFAECKVCDTVWNPLYPDDVKYHAKRHAAVAKAKRKRDDEL